jgi:hypothetical protein
MASLMWPYTCRGGTHIHFSDWPLRRAAHKIVNTRIQSLWD